LTNNVRKNIGGTARERERERNEKKKQTEKTEIKSPPLAEEIIQKNDDKRFPAFKVGLK
jgi:hypothetical protein